MRRSHLIEIIREEISKLLVEVETERPQLTQRTVQGSKLAYLYYKEIEQSTFDFALQEPEIVYSQESLYSVASANLGATKATQFSHDADTQGPNGQQVFVARSVNSDADSISSEVDFVSRTKGNEITKTLRSLQDFLSIAPTDTRFKDMIIGRYQPKLETLTDFKSFEIKTVAIIHSLNDDRQRTNSESTSVATVQTNIYIPVVNGTIPPSENLKKLEKEQMSLHASAVKELMPLSPSQISTGAQRANTA